MASVELGRTWVTLLSTGQSVNGWTGRGRTHNRKREGEVKRLAGGRFRAVSTLGVRKSQDFVLRDLAETDVLLLEEWQGQTVIVRDNRGRRMFGVYWDVNFIDRVDPTYYDVALSVTEVSYEEEQG